MCLQGVNRLGFFVGFLCSVNCLIDFTDAESFGRLVIQSDESSRHQSSDLDDIQTNAYLRSTCDGLNDCVPLSECLALQYHVAKACYSGDRSIYCGISEHEPYVCCPRNRFEKVNSCGRNLVSGQHYKGLGAFPFVARIGFKNTNTASLAYPCAGSIISRRVILTAAHCALAKADGHRLSSVRIGEYDTQTDPDCQSGFCAPPVVNHAISHVIVHPDYVSGQYHHDIALVVLKTPLNYTVAAQAICLHPDRENLVVGKRVVVVGWGKLSTSNIRLPDMQFLEVPLTPWETCLNVYGSTGALDSPKSVDGQWMCAGGESKDACQGFGGAPLVFRENGLFKQIGIMSFGSDNCGARKTPSVYTSVSHFYKWIQDNSPPE
ncbi:chymotrypsin-like protease CTRL-1 [Bradysia coprophila]|uniref:chymotrypsin-like protease CTRL-1 n=1 Tax=Bradysia coprophila TaxID=38358 RepID=UPI00187D943C|nr:chymotrypsin-like protease CTRL-1 [Bradysia coprophila]